VEYAAEVSEGVFVCFQKGLLRRVQIRPVNAAPLAIERIANT
jgi:hypothetical protein